MDLYKDILKFKPEEKLTPVTALLPKDALDEIYGMYDYLTLCMDLECTEEEFIGLFITSYLGFMRTLDDEEKKLFRGEKVDRRAADDTIERYQMETMGG